MQGCAFPIDCPAAGTPAAARQGIGVRKDGHAVLPVWDASSRPRVIELAAAKPLFILAHFCLHYRSRYIGAGRFLHFDTSGLEPAALSWLQPKSDAAHRAPCGGAVPAVRTLARGPAGSECGNSRAAMVGHGTLGPNGVVFPCAARAHAVEGARGGFGPDGVP